MNEVEARWICANEAAKYLSVHPQVIKRWTREGKLAGHGVGRVGRVYRFKKEALDRFAHQSAERKKRR